MYTHAHLQWRFYFQLRPWQDFLQIFSKYKNTVLYFYTCRGHYKFVVLLYIYFEGCLFGILFGNTFQCVCAHPWVLLLCGVEISPSHISTPGHMCLKFGMSVSRVSKGSDSLLFHKISSASIQQRPSTIVISMPWISIFCYDLSRLCIPQTPHFHPTEGQYKNMFCNMYNCKKKR